MRSQTARRLRAPTEGGGHDARNDSARSIFTTKACLHSVGGGMGLAKPLDAFRTDFDPGFAKKLIGEQASAHAYFAMMRQTDNSMPSASSASFHASTC